MGKKISVFFDTNILEVRHEEEKLHLSSIRLSSDFYRLLRFIQDKALESQVDICIPEIVWLEVREHMRSQFCSDYQSLESRVQLFRKTFGDLCDLQYSFGENSRENYIDYIARLEADFFDNLNPKVLVVNYPRNQEVVEFLVEKAVKKEKPFMRIPNGKKDFKDAGFKDAMIAITIDQYCGTNDSKGIFFTNDHDFLEIVQHFGKFMLVNSADELTLLLTKECELTIEALVHIAFEKDDYLKDIILKNLDVIDDGSLTCFQIDNVTQVGESNFDVSIVIIANEARYIAKVTYDSVANEIIDIAYTINNE